MMTALTALALTLISQGPMALWGIVFFDIFAGFVMAILLSPSLSLWAQFFFDVVPALHGSVAFLS
jgi:hypothetical protein